MKKLPLTNPSFKYLEQSFREWLDILGYAPSTVYSLPNMVREMLHYLEQININHIKELDNQIIREYYERLRERSNNTRGGSISNGHLNKHIQAIYKFTEYLRRVGRLDIPVPNLKMEEANGKDITVLTTEEINQLYQATTIVDDKPNLSEKQLEALQARDRAMLAVFYGCGARRNEGVNLNLSDVNFDKRIIHIRKGKNYKERFVPISKTSHKYLQEYIYDHRPELLLGKSEALFISNTSNRVQGQTLLIRLKVLQHRTNDPVIMQKEIGLHTLRHSIATHLLQAGMKLESISRFLGHSSLESTQIYTHLAGVKTEIKQDYPNIPKYETTQLHEDEF